MSEGLFSNKYKKLQEKVLTEIGVDFYFISTFGTAIAAFYPFFDKLVRTSKFENTLSDFDIVLLVIATLSIMMKESKEHRDKVMLVINEKGLGGLVDKFIDTMKNLTNFFTKISEIFGRTINGMIDMFSYTALYLPFMLGLNNFLELYNINFENFTQILSDAKGAAISTGIGLLTITLKHAINIVIKSIKRKLRSKRTPSQDNEVVQKFESVDMIFESYFS